MKRIVMYIVLALVAIYLAMGATLYAFQRTVLYLPLRTDEQPADVGLAEAQVRKIHTSDGETLSAWFLSGASPNLVIYFHGNADALVARPERLRQLQALGFSVLAVDYRGFGASTGKPTEAGLHRDADATYQDALSLGFSPNQMVLLGESLGSGVALELATRHAVAGLILDSPYSSIADVAAERYWLFPVRALLFDPYRSDLWIAQVHVPVLILHGTADTVVPFKFGEKLARLGGKNVTFVPIPDAEHVVFGDDAAKVPVRTWLTQLGM